MGAHFRAVSLIALSCAALIAHGCSRPDATWPVDLAEAPYEALGEDLARVGDSAIYSPAASSVLTSEQAAAFGADARAWLAAPDDDERAKAIETRCSQTDRSEAPNYVHVPLGALDAKLPDAAKTLYSALRGRTALKAPLPDPGSLKAGPYLLMMGNESVVTTPLQTCMQRVGKAAPSVAPLATSLMSLAKARDEATSAAYEAARKQAHAQAPVPMPYTPFALVWYGADTSPYAVFVQLPADLLMTEVEASAVCGFDPNTSPTLNAKQCDRLLGLEARRKSEHGSLSKDAVETWLQRALADLADPASIAQTQVEVDRKVTLTGFRLGGSK